MCLNKNVKTCTIYYYLCTFLFCFCCFCLIVCCCFLILFVVFVFVCVLCECFCFVVVMFFVIIVIRFCLLLTPKNRQASGLGRVRSWVIILSGPPFSPPDPPVTWIFDPLGRPGPSQTRSLTRINVPTDPLVRRKEVSLASLSLSGASIWPSLAFLSSILAYLSPSKPPSPQKWCPRWPPGLKNDPSGLKKWPLRPSKS